MIVRKYFTSLLTPYEYLLRMGFIVTFLRGPVVAARNPRPWTRRISQFAGVSVKLPFKLAIRQ